MAYTRLTATEAASLIKNGENLALSGFTPAGVAKAVTKELAKIAVAEHEAGREFKVGIFTGASTGQSTDGDLANANAIKYRAPYTTNNDFRKHVNAGEIPYNDLHLSHMAQELRYGFYGEVDWAILEVCDIEEADGFYKAYLTAAGGISPTAARLAKHIILELNSFHNPNAKFIHDVYEPLDPPYRKPIPIFKVGDRIGKPYVEIPKEKLVGVVDCNIPDEARAFKDSDPVTDRIGYLTAEFLVEELHASRIPKEFLPLQSGVGSTANAILGALGADKHVPDFNIYTEVIQNSVIDMMLTGRVKDASACSLTVSNECLMQVYDNMDYFKDHLTLRQSEISNHPAVIRRLGVIAINTAIEADIYGNVNSTHISGVRMMNGIGGSGDFERNAYLSIFTCPSVAKGGVISSIVPFVSHQDHSEHDVNIIVTEQGVADLRGKGPMQRAQLIIEKCAHPDYKQLLWDYLKMGTGGHTRHCLPAAFAMHDTLRRKGDMRLTDFAEYVKD
jgi:succinate CoA transferase